MAWAPDVKQQHRNAACGAEHIEKGKVERVEKPGKGEVVN